mmetsp:Transcript_19665/g.42160  ORF Transcript_19665/g.42160 Transcript_19665/m.42160 type:complete len:83 (-) Transcript_19665:2308-2556(-)
MDRHDSLSLQLCVIVVSECIEEGRQGQLQVWLICTVLENEGRGLASRFFVGDATLCGRCDDENDVEYYVPTPGIWSTFFVVQ